VHLASANLVDYQTGTHGDIAIIRVGHRFATM